MKSKIYVAGHRGLLGSALVRKLTASGETDLVLRSRRELDLCDQGAVEKFFRAERPELVFLMAGKVGGIVANSAYPADFIRDTLQIQTNVIDAAWRNGCRKLLFMGSPCIYPKICPQPIKEDFLLTGPLEPTNEAFAAAKIAGLMMGRAYRRQYGFDVITVMPDNLYGPGDNFNLDDGHVIPALLRRFHEARDAGALQVTIWGTGAPIREFLHVDDVIDACLFLMDKYSGESPINIGGGEAFSILELARRIALVVGFEGEILTDPSKPDGTPQKCLDSSRLFSLGWRPKIKFDDGLADLYRWYLAAEKAGQIRK